MTAKLAALAGQVLEAARQRRLSVATAESCTAGKLAVLLSEVPGAADYLDGGFVAYTKANKTKALGVPADLLASKGAVCGDVAVAMAEGALARSPADGAVAITGVAGPEPDEDGNPVGLVCIAAARHGATPVQAENRYGPAGRHEIQECAVADALLALLRMIETPM